MRELRRNALTLLLWLASGDLYLAWLHLLSHRNLNVQDSVVQPGVEFVQVQTRGQRQAGVELSVRKLREGVVLIETLGGSTFALENELIVSDADFQIVLRDSRKNGSHAEHGVTPGSFQNRAVRPLGSRPNG